MLGDTLEEFEHIESPWPAAARRWLRAETCRVLVQAPRHRRSRAGRPRVPAIKGDSAMSAIPRDFRYAFRVLNHAPGFTAIALLTLALGIGANTAMFAVVNAVLLKRLPFKDPGELMLVHLTVSDQDRRASAAHRRSGRTRNTAPSPICSTSMAISGCSRGATSICRGMATRCAFTAK